MKGKGGVHVEKCPGSKAKCEQILCGEVMLDEFRKEKILKSNE